MRRTVGTVMDCLACRLVSPIYAKRFAGIVVHVESGPIAGADVHANSVAFGEHIRRGIKLEHKFVSLTRVQELSLFEAVAVTCPDYRIGDVDCQALWEIAGRRLHVYQFCGEIGIHSG